MSNETVQDNTDNTVEDVFHDSLDIDEDARLMTLEEEAELDDRLENQKLNLLKSLKQYEQWSDKITRRRMFALSRVRKLQRNRTDRLKFYDDVKDMVNETETGRRSSRTSENSSTK